MAISKSASVGVASAPFSLRRKMKAKSLSMLLLLLGAVVSSSLGVLHANAESKECKLNVVDPTVELCAANISDPNDTVTVDCTDARILVPSIEDLKKGGHGCSADISPLLQYKLPPTFLPKEPQGGKDMAGEELFDELCEPKSFSDYGMVGRIDDPSNPFRTTYYVNNVHKFNQKMAELEASSDVKYNKDGSKKKKVPTVTVGCLGTDKAEKHISGLAAIISFSSKAPPPPKVTSVKMTADDSGSIQKVSSDGKVTPILRGSDVTGNAEHDLDAPGMPGLPGLPDEVADKIAENMQKKAEEEMASGDEIIVYDDDGNPVLDGENISSGSAGFSTTVVTSMTHRTLLTAAAASLVAYATLSA